MALPEIGSFSSQIAVSTQIGTKPSDGFFTVWDLSTGNVLASYLLPHTHPVDSSPIPRHCIGRLKNDSIVFSKRNSPIMFIGHMTGKQKLNKIIMPGNISALEVSSDSSFILVGIADKLHVWQTGIGLSSKALEGHYQSIRVIRISSDCSYAVTGGDDGHLCVWDLTRIMVQEGKSTAQESFTISNGVSSTYLAHTMMDFSTGILDIRLSGESRNSRIVACAEYSSIVKMYQMKINQRKRYVNPLVDIIFPINIRSILIDRIERSLYCGGEDGQIFETFLFDAHEPVQSTKTSKFNGHTQAICSMSITCDGRYLLSGSQDGTIRVWHINSGECSSMEKRCGPVTNVMIFPRSVLNFCTIESPMKTSNLRKNLNEPQANFTLKLDSLIKKPTSGGLRRGTINAFRGQCLQTAGHQLPECHGDDHQAYGPQSIKEIINIILNHPITENVNPETKSTQSLSTSASSSDYCQNNHLVDSSMQWTSFVEPGPQHKKCQKSNFQLVQSFIQYRKKRLCKIFHDETPKKLK